MKWLYFFSIQFYVLFIRFASLFNSKAKLWIEGRKNWKRNLSNIDFSKDSWIWFHCASLGEFEQGRPLIEQIKIQYPQFKILLTFFSPSGYEIRKNYEKADCICYLPIDTPSNAHFFLEKTNPKIVIFVKYEFWYFFITSIRNKKIPLFLVSSIFRTNQVFFKWYGSWYRKILNQFTTIFTQNHSSQDLLKSIGITNSIISGDTRFDRVFQIKNQRKEIEIAEKFFVKSKTLVAGSTWALDHEIIIPWINKNSDFKLIIAPHEIHSTSINNITDKLTVPYCLFSYPKNLSSCNVLIIDNIGMLSSLYFFAHIAYVGGAFGKGLHNILEPAVYGIPVIFGPKYKRFAEAYEMIACGGGFSISDNNSFNLIINDLINNSNNYIQSTKASLQYTKNQLGASMIVFNEIKNYL